MDTTALTPWQGSVLEAADMAFKAGYEAGRRDAFAQIMLAAQTAQTQAGLNTENGPTQDHSQKTNAARTSAPSRSGRARPGTVKQIVREFVLNATGPVTEHKLGQMHPEINRSSRYMAFRNLESEGVITKRNGAWVPASSVSGAGNPGGDAPGPLNQQNQTEAADVSAR